MSKSRNAVCDTRCQNFHREMAKKTEKLKTLWFIKNRQRLYDNLAKDGISQKHRLPSQSKQKIEPIKESRPPVEQRPLPPWRPPGEADDFSEMLPIKPAILDILYRPKDQSFLSKKNYLRERYKEKPDEKFYFPYCSSWEYGWRLRDYPKPRVSDRGRRAVIQSSFYRRNASSLQRDPDWYRICQTSDPNNFNDVLTY
ncbi:hypothetical protein TKK_0014920 [Trichogramma kaykai]